MAETIGISNAAIQAMSNMAGDPDKSAALVQDDACLGGLVMVLSNKDQAIVNSALEVLLKLVSWPHLRSHMRNFFGMTEQLQALMVQAAPSTQALARRVYTQLREAADRCPGHVHAKESHSHGSLRDSSNYNRPSRDTTHKRRRNSFFLGGVAKSKVIVLQLRGLNDKEDVEVCRNSLLTVKGVISITFEYKRRRVVLRTRPDLKPELLAQAVARTMTMMAEQIIKDEDGNEITVSFGKHASSLNKENEEMPDYPTETTPPRGEKDIARLGSTSPEKGKTWIGAVGNFLSNSFYW